MNVKLQKYSNFIYQYNQTKNITGFKTIDEIEKQGILDSINALEAAKNLNISIANKNVADIGAGSGFPSVPYLLTHNNFSLTIIEGMKSRCDFLSNLKNELNVDFEILNLRAENTKNLAGKFDVITARAVSNVKNMFMLTHHMLKPNGWLYLPKGKNYHLEIDEFLNIFPEQKSNIKITQYQNSNNEPSFIVAIQKTTNTPKNWPLSWKAINTTK
ncbi:16S rRNA (guanine(527)-N(7))-methyltransferase RsmG [Mycoplasmopsis mucosicanis]|uniref:Ribosomal RNA small subunit methyltransferase G n=1 Tax=Mycoplasmopsis mucosicanis TaxID=458208 RepID=A0A507SIC7_9BACT|nr:16S rRNA (guanine(527)-N(7))-methyltransferase RsmG [Mycoplasmopsis mucosicanis]TQC51487.1 16S rRNA (guanine(527)-N(7))-methyltransferase RsmG [Mycoplasmopsis mucosicanis]